MTPAREWVDLLASEHGASTRTLDFGGDPTGSREVINRWVGEQTEGLIPELLPDGFIDAGTVLVLTDAVYLKARWQTPFGKYSSVTDTFTRLDGSTQEVELMRELELADRRGIRATVSWARSSPTWVASCRCSSWCPTRVVSPRFVLT